MYRKVCPMQFSMLPLLSTTYFNNIQNYLKKNKMFKIYHKVNWKSSFIIYLLECYICNIHYIGKSDTPFNIRINNCGKDIKNPNLIPACKHFNRHGHDFNNKIHHHRTTNKHTWNINWDSVKTSRSSNLRL